MYEVIFRSRSVDIWRYLVLRKLNLLNLYYGACIKIWHWVDRGIGKMRYWYDNNVFFLGFVVYVVFESQITCFNQHSVINFVKHTVIVERKRSSCPEVFCKKRVLRNSVKFTGKHLYQRLFFNEFAANLLKKSLCFPVNFAKLHLFLQNTFGGCLWGKVQTWVYLMSLIQEAANGSLL